MEAEAEQLLFASDDGEGEVQLFQDTAWLEDMGAETR